MSDQERIEALEQMLKHMHKQIMVLTTSMRHQLGAASVYHGAIGALIESHHAYDKVSPLLNQMYAEMFALANGESNNEEFLEGMQLARDRVADSLRISEAKQPLKDN